ncbi:unnamed protein product [Rangifer tarandus platyrhynchus]|uniref:Uncharacterized protein n=2 Tax=Rangifer tarandus platyrhynchus TaxID=3082113 RepID=A0AC59Z0Q4_RANTA|nr:unnamed protein product [Rangifer tarandus platyrhynchus]
MRPEAGRTPLSLHRYCGVSALRQVLALAPAGTEPWAKHTAPSPVCAGAMPPTPGLVLSPTQGDGWGVERQKALEGPGAAVPGSHLPPQQAGCPQVPTGGRAGGQSTTSNHPCGYLVSSLKWEEMVPQSSLVLCPLPSNRAFGGLSSVDAQLIPLPEDPPPQALVSPQTWALAGSPSPWRVPAVLHPHTGRPTLITTRWLYLDSDLRR